MSKKKRLAVVNDNLISREGLVMMIGTFLKDTDVRSFSGGKEILKSMEEGTEYDLVLMDGTLTDGPTGPMYTAKILEKSPETAVVGISSDGRLWREFIEAGAKTFLPIEAKIVDIERTIKMILGI